MDLLPSLVGEDSSVDDDYEESFDIDNKEEQSDDDYNKSTHLKSHSKNRRKLQESSFVSLLGIKFPTSCYAYQYKWKFNLEFITSMKPDQAHRRFLNGFFIDQEINSNRTPKTKNRGIKDDDFTEVVRVEIIRETTKFHHYNMTVDDSFMGCSHNWLKRIKWGNELELAEYLSQEGLNSDMSVYMEEWKASKKAKKKAGRGKSKRGVKKKASSKEEKQEQSDKCSEEVTSKEDEEQLAEVLSTSPSNGLLITKHRIQLKQVNSAIVFNIDCSSKNFGRTDMNAIVEYNSAKIQLKLDLYDDDADLEEEAWKACSKNIHSDIKSFLNSYSS